MPVNTDMKKLIERQVKTLDYLKGEGLFPRGKREINPYYRYLIVSYGGTGAAALHPLKKLLKEELTEEQYKEYVRLLCVDTDQATRYDKVTVRAADGSETTKNVERFSPDEFFWLNNVPAREMIKVGTLGSMQNWANPTLLEEIKADERNIDGTGAGATRQFGRILLAADENFQNFCIKIQELVSQLTNGKNTKLKVLIISGISGGTGSGIVVDATYILRHAIKAHSQALYDQTSFDGFIMLPPTGTSKDILEIQRGNRNGISALKEIDHFMGIAKRGERYQETFGTTLVASDNPIFTTCYLLDGSKAGIVINDPRGQAVEVLKDCILDMITSMPTDTSAAGAQDVFSFMSDANAYTQTLVNSKPTSIAPREVNYCYCALGHGKMQIPLELMKAYVAKCVFDRMYDLFSRCSNVTPADVENFLKAAGAPGDGITDGAFRGDANELKATVNKAVLTGFNIDPNNQSKKGGPYYMVNLIDKAKSALVARKNTVSAYIMCNDKKARVDQYGFIHNLISNHGTKLFDVYTEVLEQLKEQLKSGSDILCDSELMKGYYHSSYSFTPISFGTTDEASKIVKQHLDQLINGTNVYNMCSDLIKEMFAKREEWTQLVADSKTGAAPKFAAAKRFREFWQININKIVNANLEDYLIKYYSSNPDAHWEEDPQNPGQGTPEAQKNIAIAAAALVNEMYSRAGHAAPLVSLNSAIGFDFKDFNPHQTFLIPKSAPNLLKAVAKHVRDHKQQDSKSIKIASSLVDDQISCYTQYGSIPAFMLLWATKAEPNYEHALSMNERGMHMSETAGGQLWKNFPNPIPPQTWTLLNPDYTPSREIGLRNQVKDLFDRSLALGMADTSDQGGTHYYFHHLPTNMLPNPGLFLGVDFETPGSKSWIIANDALMAAVSENAQKLFAMYDWANDEDLLAKASLCDAVKDKLNVALVVKHLQPLQTCMNAQTQEGLTDWEKTLAPRLLRNSTEYTMLLRGTVLVFEALYELISNAQAKQMHIVNFAKFLVADLFDYVAADMAYYYVTADGYQKELFAADYGDAIQELYPEYFLYNKYLENPDAVADGLMIEYEKVAPSGTDVRAEKVQRAAALNAKKDLHKDKVAKLLTFDRTKPNEGLKSKQFEKDCAGFKHDAEDIREFYSKLLNTLTFFKA